MLKKRLCCGLLLAAVTVSGIYTLPGPVLWVATLLVVAMGQWEFIELSARPGPDRLTRWTSLALGAAWMVGVFRAPRLPDGVGPAVFWSAAFMVLMALQMRPGRPGAPHQAAWALLGVLYVPVLASFMLRILWTAGPQAGLSPAPAGRLSLLFMLAVVKLSDVGAYAVGMTLGRTPLCPRLSPAKTREGLAGGILTGVLAAGLLAGGLARLGTGFRLPLHDAVALGVLISLAGVLGDLVESLIKRAAGAKDSGRRLPGMGGVLDVLDSILFAAPVYFVYLRIRGL